MNDLADVFETVVAMLERMQIRYAVMGGLAVRVYGIPRPTYDVDFTVAINNDELSDLLNALEGIGIAVADAYRSGWVDRVAGMPLIKTRCYLHEAGVDVDFFLADSPFQHELLARRQRITTGHLNVWIVSPEDLVLLKLASSRPRDISDAENILFTQGQLDVGYMRKWGEVLGIKDKLEQVLIQSSQLEGR